MSKNIQLLVSVAVQIQIHYGLVVLNTCTEWFQRSRQMGLSLGKHTSTSSLELPVEETVPENTPINKRRKGGLKIDFILREIDELQFRLRFNVVLREDAADRLEF